MGKPKVTTNTVKVSRLGCMRKSTVISNDEGRSVERVEVWVPGVDDSSVNPGKKTRKSEPRRK